MNDGSYLTPHQISEHPELTALQILRATTSIARKALLASHPDLCNEHWDHHRTVQDAYAMAILCQANALDAMLRQYMDSIQRLRMLQRQQAEDRSS